MLLLLRSTVIHHVLVAVITKATSINYAVVEVRFVIGVHWLEVLLGRGGDGKTPRDERLALSGKATHSGTLFQITIIFIYSWKSRALNFPNFYLYLY